MSFLGKIGGTIGHFIKGAGPIGLMAGGAGYMMDRAKANSAKHAAEFKAEDKPYVIDSNGESVSRPLTDAEWAQKEANARFPGNEPRSNYAGNPGTGEYYIIYPPDWPFDTSKDKVILDADGNYNGLKIAAYDSPDKATREKALTFNTKYHHGQSSTFVKVNADGTPDFSTATSPKWNPDDTIAPGVKQAMESATTQDSTTTQDGTGTATDGTAQIPTSTIPADINIPNPSATAGLPENLRPGVDQFVQNTQNDTQAYDEKEKKLWDDYVKFEPWFFGKANNNYDNYNANMASIPRMSFKLPGSMGGASFDMAPQAHAKLYGEQAATNNRMLDSIANNAIRTTAAMDTLAGKQLAADLAQRGNAFLPTATALELYKLEREGQLEADKARAGTPDNHRSPWSTWAPVVGQLLQPGADGSSIIGNGWDWLSNNIGGSDGIGGAAADVGNWYDSLFTNGDDILTVI